MNRNRTIRWICVAALAACLGAAGAVGAHAQWVSLGGADGDPVGVRVLESTDARVVLEYTLPGYRTERVAVGDRQCIVVGVEGAVPRKERGVPELPVVDRSIVIPDRTHMAVRMVEADYVTVQGVTVAPSKGFLSRRIDPATVPRVFGPIYERDVWTPQPDVLLHEPYIFRDMRGVVVEFHPFRFNPARSTLRVCRRAVVEVAADGPGRANVKERRTDRIQGDFVSDYARHFLNYGRAGARYVPIQEPGRLCIVVYDPWAANVAPLADWKERKGIETVVVSRTDAGGTAAGIKAYLQALYDSPGGLAYAILVGDVAQMPYFLGGFEGAPCDSIYGRLEGNDLYPDVYVSRLSAQSAAEVDAQVLKFVSYEREPSVLDDWYRDGVAVASNEGSPPDYARMDEQFVQLEGYGYRNTCKQYQGSGGSTSGITACLNDGRGILGYYGHGSGVSWGSVYFGVDEVNALVNADQIPWIFEASCDNGNMTIGTCFAEAWLRAASGGRPSGAIACYMGSTNESWDPPVYGCEEEVDVFTSEAANTCGGVYYAGSMHVLDLYPGTGSEGEKYMDQCILFGDASLQLRSRRALTPVVDHPAAVPLGPSQITVTVTAGGGPFAGALVCVRQVGTFSTVGVTGGDGSVVLDLAPGSADPMEITVTGYNLVPYEGTIQPVADGPYVTYLSHLLADDGSGGSSGNGDGEANPTERLGLLLTLENFGNADADSVSVDLATADPYLSVADGSAWYGTIPAHGEGSNQDPLLLDVSHAAPNGHIAPVHVTVQNATPGGTLEFDVDLTVVGPVVTFVAHVVHDTPAGNGDGDADMGETVFLEVALQNTGSLDLTSVSAVVAADEPWYASVLEDTASFPDLPAGGGSGSSLPPHFEVRIDPAAPCGEPLHFQLEVSGLEGVSSDAFVLGVGGTGIGVDDDMESGPGDWTHSGIQDTWSIVDFGNSHSPTHSWHAEAVSYVSDQRLVTPEFTVTALSQMTFWHTYEVEDGWDGCVIEITTDGGQSWQDLGDRILQGGYDAILYTGYGCPLEGRPAWTGGTIGPMTEVVVDLAPYQGSAAQVRFRIATDDFYSSYPGWYVDDVRITGAECQPWGETGVFTCSIECLTPVVHPGERAEFRLTVSNLTDADRLATVATNIYRCGGGFYMEHIRKEGASFTPLRSVTKTVHLKIPARVPASWKDCDIPYELVVIDASTGVEQCREGVTFRIQD